MNNKTTARPRGTPYNMHRHSGASVASLSVNKTNKNSLNTYKCVVSNDPSPCQLSTAPIYGTSEYHSNILMPQYTNCVII